MSIRCALKAIAQLTCGVEIQTYLAHHLSIAVERDTPRSYFRTGGCADRARYDALALATNAASSNDHWY